VVLVNAHIEIELAFNARCELAEGPVWEPIGERLAWVDIPDRSIHWFRPSDGTHARRSLPGRAGSIAPRVEGGMVIAMEDGFWILDAEQRLRHFATIPAANAETRMNDGKCDPGGRFWAGSVVREGKSRTGALWRLDADGNVTPVVTGVTMSNGMGWSPDGLTFYYIDTAVRRVDAFTFDPGSATVHHRRPLIELPDGPEKPDGMTVDAEGFLWVALWQGWAVNRYAPDGRFDLSIRLPVALVTSCVFGGPDLGDLYITTARSGLSEADFASQPLAGGVFRCRPGPRGLSPSLFAG
jgi:sugar lactone lactonase YvrE